MLNKCFDVFNKIKLIINYNKSDMIIHLKVKGKLYFRNFNKPICLLDVCYVFY